MLRTPEQHERLMLESRVREALRKEMKKSKSKKASNDTNVISMKQHKKLVANYKAEIRQLKRQLKEYKQQIKQLKYIERSRPFIGDDVHSITINYKI